MHTYVYDTCALDTLGNKREESRSGGNAGKWPTRPSELSAEIEK